MYNPWKDNYEPQNRERTESGYSSGSFASYAAPEGGAPYTPFEQYDSNSAIYSPSVQLGFYFPRQESNGSPSENPEIKTPLVANFSKQLPVETSPLAAFWCQGSSKDFHLKITAKIKPFPVINTFCMFWNTLRPDNCYAKWSSDTW